MRQAFSGTAGGELKRPLAYRRGLHDLRDKHLGKVGAIVGTGTSLESLDMAILDGYEFTVGLNEAPKLYSPDYLMIIDTRAVAKVMGALNDPSLIAVVGESTIEQLLHTPPYSPQGVAADEVFAKLAGVYVFQRTTCINADELACVGGALSAALSLCLWMGAAEVHLYGCDFYRTRDRKYAFNLHDPPDEVMHAIGRSDRYTTPAMVAMIEGLEMHRSLWTPPMKVVNKNPLSELKWDGDVPC